MSHSKVNNQSECGCYAETAFKAVFGQGYHWHIKCPVAEAHKCITNEECLSVSNDFILEAVTEELWFVDTDDATQQNMVLTVKDITGMMKNLFLNLLSMRW